MKKFLKKVLGLFCDLRDPATIADDFAKAAFKEEGYVVQKRESVARYTGDVNVLSGDTVTYSLKKEQDDGKEYTGSITSALFNCASSVMYAHGPVSTVIRYNWVNNDIKPKA